MSNNVKPTLLQKRCYQHFRKELMDKYLIKEIKSEIKKYTKAYKECKGKDIGNECGFYGVLTTYKHVLSLIKKYKKI